MDTVLAKIINVLSTFNNANDDVIVKYDLLSNTYNAEKFPATYAGTYYNSAVDKKMNIYVTDKEKSYSFLSLVNSNDINVIQVKFSLVELLNCLKKVTDNVAVLDFSYAKIIQKDNKIHISFSKDETKNAFPTLCKNIGINSSMIIVDENSEKISPVSSIKAGERIVRNGESLTTSGGTVACNCYRPQTGQYGVLTCGHVIFNSTQYVVDASNKVIGSNFSTKHIGGDRDCVFIPFTNSSMWTQTNSAVNVLDTSIAGTITGYTYPHSSYEGSSVVKYGVATGYNSGVITSVYCSVPIDYSQLNLGIGTITLSDMIGITNSIVATDSGGPVALETGSGTNRQISILGLTTASNSGGGGYACKITNIIGNLGLSIVT